MKNAKNYPPDWKDVIRPAILKRDLYVCTMCPTRHRTTGYYDSRKNFIACDEFMLAWAKAQGKKVFTIYLQVIHLDHNPANCDNFNLASACPRCHLRYDRQYNIALRKLAKRKYVSKPIFSGVTPIY